MPTPSVPPISINDVCVEFGLSKPRRLGDATMRNICGKPTGDVRLSDFLNKSNVVADRQLISPITMTASNAWASAPFNNPYNLQNLGTGDGNNRYYYSGNLTNASMYLIHTTDFGAPKFVQDVRLLTFGARDANGSPNFTATPTFSVQISDDTGVLWSVITAGTSLDSPLISVNRTTRFLYIHARGKLSGYGVGSNPNGSYEVNVWADQLKITGAP